MKEKEIKTKTINEIIKELEELKNKVNTEFLKIDISLLENKLKKLFDIK